MPLPLATWVTAEKSRCLAGSSPNLGAVAVLGLGHAVEAVAGLGDFDDRGHVVGIAVHRHAPLMTSRDEPTSFR